jgi:predicted phage terminase large subunit-like protein
MIVWGVFSQTAPESANRVIPSDQKQPPTNLHPSDSRVVPKAMMIEAWEKYLKLHDLVMLVADKCKKFKVDLLLIENKASGISVSQELRRLFGMSRFGIQMFDPKSQDKVARLNSVAPLFYEGLVYAPSERLLSAEGDPWVENVIAQAERFPKSRHDEYVDCISMGIRHLRENGLICRTVEREAEIEESKQYRGREQPLYSV